MLRVCMHMASWLLVLLLVQTTAQDYTTDGPCAVVSKHMDAFQLPQESNCSSWCTMTPSVYVPGLPCQGAQYPVVVIFSGFKMSASYYAVYAKRLASWGFAAVQYDLPLLHIVPDETEVGFLPYLLDHLSHHPDTAGLLDPSRMATAGHSRGGKLAALHLAGTPNVHTAFLIDPVDSSSYTPPSPEDPSAVEALRGKAKTAAITGAGVSGPCNPTSSNYQLFWDVLAAGSWLEVVPAGGHMSFADISSSVVQHALDWLCHAGHSSHQHVIELTAPALVAWMELALCQQPLTTTKSAAAAGADAAATYLQRSVASLPWPMARTAGALGHQQLHRHLTYTYLSPDAVVGAGAPHAVQRQLQSLRAFFGWVRREQSMGEITFEIKQ